MIKKCTDSHLASY